MDVMTDALLLCLDDVAVSQAANGLLVLRQRWIEF